MSKGTHDPFTPHGELSPEQLRAYLEGRLSAEERHAVELHLEQDLFARDAAEGLAIPGAVAGLSALDAARPSVQATTAWVWFTLAVAIIALVGWWVMPTSEEPTTIARTTVEAPAESIQEPVGTSPLQSAEIAAAVEIPETLYIGHKAEERSAVPAEQVVEAREPLQVDRIKGIDPALDTAIEPASPRATRSKKSSLQLMFLHDLKLVDPKEMYKVDPMLFNDERHVNANFSDREQQRKGQEPQRLVKYTPFMDAALEKFTHHAHKACLEDLRFLLQQYPDDVNALFYAGLCSYNLGLNERARVFFHRAATHPIQVFNEEAVWYHALTLSRLGEQAAATEAYARIASEDGFYAERAKERLRQVAK